MNLALTYLWKEWRAQRGLLVAYTLLVFTCLCIGLYLAPRHSWFDDGFGAHAVSWFVCAGGIGVVAFVVPALVRGEYVGPKGDQFVRRLPGALWPAFWGKLLFLVLATLLLPLLGLLVGELFVESLDQHWFGLYRWGWDGEVWMNLPWVVHALAAGLALVPWIWAVGTWTPGGRLALLGTVLLVLVVGLLVFAVERQAPKIFDGVRWQSWLWLVPVTGLVVAALSWTRGRLGGGPMRSARVGLLATGVMLLPGGAWLGERAWSYHHPNLENALLGPITGLSPDGRFALARISENENWLSVPVRIDLRDGAIEQIGGVHLGVMSEVLAPFSLGTTGVQRYWRTWDWRGDEVQGIYDLVTRQWVEVAYDRETRRILPDEDWEAKVLEERRATTKLQAPGGVRVWIDGEELVYEAPDGSVERRPWRRPGARSIYPIGHAFTYYGESRGAVDLVNGEEFGWDQMEAFHVGGVRVLRPKRLPRGAVRWDVVDGDETRELEGVWRILGLFDDRRLLATVRPEPGTQKVGLELIDPATGEREPLDCPVETATWVSHVSPMALGSSLLPRDPDGGVWVQFESKNQPAFVRIAASGDATRLDRVTSRIRLLSWTTYPKVLVRDRYQIVELDVETGARRVLFGGKASR